MQERAGRESGHGGCGERSRGGVRQVLRAVCRPRLPLAAIVGQACQIGCIWDRAGGEERGDSRTAMVQGFRAVVFDFDFTLADASAGIIPAVNGALQDIGQPQTDEGSVRAIIGLSLPEVLRELTGITTPPELVDKFASRFIARADSLEDSSEGRLLSTVLPGVTAALEALRAAGLRMAIASTKGRDRIAELLQLHGLAGYFDAVVGAEDVPAGRLKPAPDALHQAAVRSS